MIAVATLALGAPEAFAQNVRKVPLNILPITIQNVTVQGGQLVATGAVGVHPIVLPITLTPKPALPGAQPGQACPILDLRLGPINLSLLGLNVDTSPICLEITAHEGGGLLGDLLCSVANLLNQGTPLADVLAGLTPAQLGILDRGLSNLLNQVLAVVTSASALQGASCSVLSLALGPLDLNLLGLQVHLDDCSNGPVTVDITATPGGGLLGDLLCSLADTPRTRAGAIARLLQAIAGIIGGLVG